MESKEMLIKGISAKKKITGTIKQYKEGEYSNDTVGRLEYNNDDYMWGVNTCKAPDTGEYETGWSHPEHNGCNTVIAEVYKNIQEARDGHKKWSLQMINGAIKPNKSN